MVVPRLASEHLLKVHCILDQLKFLSGLEGQPYIEQTIIIKLINNTGMSVCHQNINIYQKNSVMKIIIEMLPQEMEVTWEISSSP